MKNKNNIIIKWLLGFFFVISSLILVFPAQAEDFVEINRVSAGVDYTFISPQQKIQIKILGATHQNDIYVKALTLVTKDKIANYFDLNNLVPADDLYSIKITSAAQESFTVRPQVTIAYDDDNNIKEPYWFNWRELRWKKMAAIKDIKRRTISFALPEEEEVIFTLFNLPSIEGKASWYVHPKYPSDLMAASTDFPIGAKLKVTAINNGKQVIVTVKDYGPDKNIHPDRILDLSKTAFKALAPIGAGVIPVRVEPYQEMTEATSSTNLSI